MLIFKLKSLLYKRQDTDCIKHTLDKKQYIKEVRLRKGPEGGEKEPCYGKMDQRGTICFQRMNNDSMYQSEYTGVASDTADPRLRITQNYTINAHFYSFSSLFN